MADTPQNFIQLPPGARPGAQFPHNAGRLPLQANNRPGPQPVAGPGFRQPAPQQLPQARMTGKPSQIRPQVQTDEALARRPIALTPTGRPPQPPPNMIPRDWYDEDATEMQDLEDDNPQKPEERLSSYKIVRLEKQPIEDFNDPLQSQDLSWKNVKFVPVNDVSQRDILNRIRELDTKGGGVMEKRERLKHPAQRHVEKAAAKLNKRDRDPRYYHELVQLEDMVRTTPSHRDHQSHHSKIHKKKSSHKLRSRTQSREKPKKLPKERIGIICYFRRCPRPGQNYSALLEELEGAQSPQAYPLQSQYYSAPSRPAVPSPPPIAQMRQLPAPHGLEHGEHPGPAGPLGGPQPGVLHLGPGHLRPQIGGGQPASNIPRPQQALTQGQLPPPQRQLPPTQIQQDQRPPTQPTQYSQGQIQYPQGPLQKGPPTRMQQSPQGQPSDRGIIQLSRPQQGQSPQYQHPGAHQGQIVHARQPMYQGRDSPPRAIDMNRNQSNSGRSERDSIVSVSSYESSNDSTGATSLDSPHLRGRRMSTTRHAAEMVPFEAEATRYRQGPEYVLESEGTGARMTPRAVSYPTIEDINRIKDEEYQRDLRNEIRHQQMEEQMKALQREVLENRELLRREHMLRDDQDRPKFQRLETMPAGMQRVVRVEQRLQEEDDNRPRFGRRESMPVNVIQRQSTDRVHYFSRNSRAERDEDDSLSRGVASLTVGERRLHHEGHQEERPARGRVYQERVLRQEDTAKSYTTGQPRRNSMREPQPLSRERRLLSREPRAVSQERRSGYYAV